MRYRNLALATALIIGVGLYGCASGPTTVQKGTLGGAAAGAILGQAIGRDTESTVIGAAAGAAVGAVAADAYEKSQEKKAAIKERDETIADQRAELERLRKKRAEAAKAAPAPGSGEEAKTLGRLQDPTRGAFTNSTGWMVDVYIDRDGNYNRGRPDITLNPYDEITEFMDVGAHKIHAVAYVDTSKGVRTVGEYSESVEVDVRKAGWTVNFDEGDFK